MWGDRIFLLMLGGNILKKGVILLILFLLVNTVFASNQLISYQGRVGQNGESVQSGNLSIYIYDASSGGTLVWTDDFLNAIDKGYFDVVLGNSTPLTLVYGKHYWIDMDVNNENINWTNGADRIEFESGVGSITTSVQNQSGWIKENNFVYLYDVNDFIGIGTLSPSANLDVNGSVNVLGEINVTGNFNMIGLINMFLNKIINLSNPINPQDAATKFYVDNNIAALNSSSNSDLNYTNNTLNNKIDSVNASLNSEITNRGDADSNLQGNISALLSENFSVNLRVDSVNASLNSEITNRGDADSNLQGNISALLSENVSVNLRVDSVNASLNSEITNRGDADTSLNLSIDSLNTTKANLASPTFTGNITFPNGIWNSSGNVGIGTVSPTQKLDVNGTIYGYSLSNYGILGNSTNSYGGYFIGGSSGGGINAYSVNGIGINATSDNSYGGYFRGGIGGVNAYSMNGYGVNGTSNNGFGGYFSSLNSYALITGTGNVGIGTNVPRGRMDVVTGSNGNNINGDGVGTLTVIGDDWGMTSNRGNIEAASNNNQAIDLGGSITFGGRYITASAGQINFATIKSGKANSVSNDFAGYLSFGTRPSGLNIAERMRITDTGNIGIGTTSPTNILSFGNTQSQKIWIETTSNVLPGQNLTISSGSTTDVDSGLSFVGLGQNSGWYGMAAAPNGNVYVVSYNEDIYMRTNGVGSFTALSQGAKSWQGITVAPNGNVYASERNGDIYMQTNGSGNFMPLNQTSRQWVSMTAAPNGNVYAAIVNGDIYMQTNGSGNFTGLGQISRTWFGMAAAPNGNVYASNYGGDIYMQTNGAGSFNPLSQTNLLWFSMAAASNGDIYAGVESGDIYVQTGGTGSFLPLSQTSRMWYGLAVAPNGDIYAAANWNDIYIQGYDPGSPNLNGGNLVLSSGKGKGNGTSTISFMTGTTLNNANTTLQSLSEKMTILGNGNVGIGTTTPTQKLDVNGSGNFSGVNAQLFVNGSQVCTAANGLCGSTTPYQSNASGWTNTSTTTSTSLNINVNSGKFFVNATSGNVGIGTTNPNGYKLNVQAAYVSTALISTTGTNPAYALMANEAGGGLSGIEGNTTGVLFTDTIPYATVFGSYYNKATQFATNNAVKMTISANGDVGIGTTSPGAKLEIVGDVYINSTGSKLIMRSPDGTCSSCGPDNSDVWSCSSVACP